MLIIGALVVAGVLGIYGAMFGLSIHLGTRAVRGVQRRRAHLSEAKRQERRYTGVRRPGADGYRRAA